MNFEFEPTNKQAAGYFNKLKGVPEDTQEILICWNKCQLLRRGGTDKTNNLHVCAWIKGRPVVSPGITPYYKSVK